MQVQREMNRLAVNTDRAPEGRQKRTSAVPLGLEGIH
jgi:hypothetical protein